MYYKVEICLATENLWLNPKTKNYEGSDPDTYQDHGVVDTIKGTLEHVRSELNKRYGLKNAEVFEGRIELSFDGEHDYRMPVEDRIPFVENYTILLTKVIETHADASVLLEVKKEGAS